MSLVLLLLACQNDPPVTSPVTPPAESTLQPLRLALNWFPEPEFGGFYEGVLGGHYAAAGFQVEIIPGGPGAPSLELLATGRADLAITTGEDLLLKRAGGVQAIAVFPAFQLNPTGILVHDPGPSSFAEIQGGNMAIEVGAPFQSFLWKRYGWEGKVQPVPTTGSLGPFLADPSFMQQGYITSEPCVAQAQGAKVRFLAANEAGWNPYGVVLAVPDPAPAWVDSFTAATLAAWRAYLDQPSRANAEISRLNEQMRPEMMDCITQAQRPFVLGQDGLGAQTAERWDALAQQLVDLGLLPAGSSANGAWRAPKQP